MQIIIDISESLYETIKEEEVGNSVYKAIKNGKPLLKGHGRIIDESKISKCEQIGLVIKDSNTNRCFLTDAPTIIERDKKVYDQLRE